MRGWVAHALMEVLVSARGVILLVPVTLVSMVIYVNLKKMPVNHHHVVMATVWISCMDLFAGILFILLKSLGFYRLKKPW